MLLQSFNVYLKLFSPGHANPLAGVSSHYAKVAGSISGQVTYGKQPVNEQQMNVSLSLCPLHTSSLSKIN